MFKTLYENGHSEEVKNNSEKPKIQLLKYMFYLVIIVNFVQRMPMNTKLTQGMQGTIWCDKLVIAPDRLVYTK